MLHEKIIEADKDLCRDKNGTPLLTLIDYRASILLRTRIGGDRYRIKTTCPTIIGQLYEFMENKSLISKIPRKGLVVCLSETGNRDRYLKRYLYKLGFTNIT